MKNITEEWLESADLDIENIRHIIHDQRLTGHVAFHAQQAIEKTLKAIIEEYDLTVPKIHSLQKLYEIAETLIEIPYDEDIIIALDSLYIESRYPIEFGLLPSGKPDQKLSDTFFEFAKLVKNTVKNNLLKKNM